MWLMATPQSDASSATDREGLESLEERQLLAKARPGPDSAVFVFP